MTYLVPLNPPSSLVLEGEIETVDIETGFDDYDFISVALPDFPLSDLNLSETKIIFTSNTEGNFAAGLTVEVSFDQSLTTLIEGDSELRFNRGLLSSLDLSAISGVRFDISTTGSCDFRCLAIRCLHKDWVYAPLDTDTLRKNLRYPVSLDGSNASFAFPNEGSDDFPILIRSAHPPGALDPTPVDASLSVGFNTGSMTDDNRVSIFLREKASDYISMLELEGTELGELNGRPQPDFGDAKYASRTQYDFDAINDTQAGPLVDGNAEFGYGLTMDDLNGLPQFDLERKPDTLSAAYIEIRLEWNDEGGALSIYDSESPSPFYSFPLTALSIPGLGGLAPQLDYVMFIDIEEKTCRVRIFTVNGYLADELALDTTRLNNTGLFKRRKGRLAWSADFSDGDAYLDHVRPRYLNFAEYRSNPFTSVTPMTGIQVQAGATSDRDLFQGIYSGPWGGEFEGYPERGPQAFKVRNTATKPLQGIRSNSIYIDDFNNTQLSFQILISQKALDIGSMHAFLWNGLQAIPLPSHHLVGDAWNILEYSLSSIADTAIPNYYSLVIVQSAIGLPNDWIIDKMTVSRKSILWQGRTYQPDVWGQYDQDWIPFDKINQSYGGVALRERGRSIQVQAKALRQEASIGEIRIEPKYAELGRFVWEDQKDEANTTPSGSISTTIENLTVTFQASASDYDGYIASYLWSFGDGAQEFGEVATHTYKTTGTYPITLVITDNRGKRTMIAEEVTI